MDAKQLHKLMDSCRPGHDDLSDPEMRALAAAMAEDAELRRRWSESRAWDMEMRAALHGVPVPSGLAERLVQSAKERQQQGRAEEEEWDGQADRAEQAAGVGQPQSMVRANGQRGARRQRWVAVAACLMTLAGAIAIVVWFGPWRDELTSVQVANMARRWMRTLDREAWHAARPPLSTHPIDPSLRFASIRWQRLRALDDRQAVAYQAALPPDGAVAYLLVVRTRRAAWLPTTPPMVPQSTTEGLCIGTWQSRGLLYVLAVPGSQRQYRRAINSQSFVMQNVGPTQNRGVRS